MLINSNLFSQSLTLDFAGYAKNLAIRSKSVLSQKSFWLNTTRLRTKAIFNAAESVRAEAWLDTEMLAGDFLTTFDFEFSDAIERPKFIDLDWTVDQGAKHQVRQSLFRAFATVYAGPLEITAGRQRIAWGTGFAWNPTDLLNPFNPVAIELEEKAGVDAMHAAMALGELSRIEAAYAPGRGRLRSSYAAKLTSNIAEYDFSLMSGRFRGDVVLGGDFAGYLGTAGFRGEFAYTFKEGQEDFLRAALNADYNFPHDYYALIEFYYNGQGEADKGNYNLMDVISGDSFNLAKLYAAASISKSITPLFNASLYSIFNLNDRSSLIGPSLIYSLTDNLDFSASTYILLGADDSEYGQLETSYFAALQYFF